MGPSTEISATRSRCDLWLRVRRHHERHGCAGSGNGTASALAKSIRRTAGGFHPPRMSGPHHCSRNKATSQRIGRWGDSTTDTCDAPLNRNKPVASTFGFFERKCRFALIYLARVLLIQDRILS